VRRNKAGDGSKRRAGENYLQAARAADGTFLFVYVPCGNKLAVDMTKLRVSKAVGHQPLAVSSREMRTVMVPSPGL
jgi:hypothetical protein